MKTFESVMTLRQELVPEIQRIRAAILDICPSAKVVLFGSALNPAAAHVRDLDFLVVIPDELNFKLTRKRIVCEVPRTQWALDIIVVPASFLAQKIKEGGNFYAFACAEGLVTNEAA